MRKLLAVALGILTSIGGFLDVGAIATSAQAGSEFGFALIWAIALGTICVICLVEMSGRLAAVSGHSLADAVRERFGFRFYVVPLVAELCVDFLVLAAELGGVCLALQLVTGVAFRLWALPVGFVVWLLLWRGTYGLIEKGVALLGLVTLAFVVAVLKLHPVFHDVLAGLRPSLPHQKIAHYCFLVVAILGALISPYLFYFYSSGAIEDRWTVRDLGSNRLTSVVGMGFGSLVSISVLIVAALVLQPQGVQVEHYEQAAPMLVPAFGAHWGLWLFAASLGIACFGAALEVALSVAYVTAQALGWNWGESLQPKRAARFSSIYSVWVLAASLLMFLGLDPLQLTLFSMALTTLTLPMVIFPFLILMNDERYVGQHRNGWLTNLVVLASIVLAFILALVAIPLEIFAG